MVDNRLSAAVCFLSSVRNPVLKHLCAQAVFTGYQIPTACALTPYSRANFIDIASQKKDLT